jgi:DNA repair exonuclease SbcCD ATPase subunit
MVSALFSMKSQLPSRSTFVKATTGYTSVATATCGVAVMVSGVTDNNKMKIYAGAGLFLSNVLGYYAFTDLCELQEVVTQLKDQIKLLQTEITKLTSLKDQLEDLLEKIQEEEQNYESITETLKRNLLDLAALNAEVTVTASQIPKKDEETGKFRASVEEFKLATEAFKEKARNISGSRNDINLAVEKISTYVALLDDKTRDYNTGRDHFTEAGKLIEDLLEKIKIEKKSLLQQQESTREERRLIMTKLNTFKGTMTSSIQHTKDQRKFVQQFQEENTKLRETLAIARGVLSAYQKIEDFSHLNSFATPLRDLQHIQERLKTQPSTVHLRIPSRGTFVPPKIRDHLRV